MNKKQLLHFPLVKLVIGIIICVGTMIIGQTLLQYVLTLLHLEKDTATLLSALYQGGLLLVAYVLFVQFYERRRPLEVVHRSFFKYLALGIALGATLQTLTILVIYLKGGYHIRSINPLSFIIPALGMSIFTSMVEEVLFRGLLFRIIAERWGSYSGLLVSAIIFGSLHGFNPNSALLPAIGLIIQAGLLLGAAYIYTQNLWFPIGIHFGWNFFQAGIFGANVSGHTKMKAWLTTEIEGATWFTGGTFGPEGSIQATIVCLIATIILLVWSHKKRKITRYVYH